MCSFLKGQVARVSCAVADLSGAPSDPTTILVKIKFPDGTLVTHLSDVIRDSIGNYHYDQVLSQAGTHGIRWETYGLNQGAVEDVLYVTPETI